MPCRFVCAPVQQLCIVRVGRAVTVTSLSTCRAQHPQLTFGTKLTPFQEKKKHGQVPGLGSNSKCSNSTIGCSQIGLRTNVGGGENRTHWQHPLPRDLSPQCSQIPPRDRHSEAGEALGTAGAFFSWISPSFVFLCSPLSFCRDLSSRDRCSYTTVGAQGAQRDTNTQFTPTHLHPQLYPPAWSREGTFGLQTMGIPDKHTDLTQKLHSGLAFKPQL